MKDGPWSRVSNPQSRSNPFFLKARNLSPATIITVIAGIAIAAIYVGPHYLNSNIPEKSDIEYVNGTFKKQSFNGQNYNFNSSEGRLLEVACEPKPAINECIPSEALNRNLHIGVARDRNSDAYIILSANAGPEQIFTYDDRVRFIKSTSITTTRAGEQVRQTPNSTVVTKVIDTIVVLLTALLINNYLNAKRKKRLKRDLL